MKSKHVKVVVRTRPTSDFANDILQISPETNVNGIKIYMINIFILFTTKKFF